MVKVIQKMTDEEWRKLEIDYDEGKITSEKLLEITETQDEHPEWWEHPCLCYLCKSYGD